jgi:hypothetical protein
LHLPWVPRDLNREGRTPSNTKFCSQIHRYFRLVYVKLHTLRTKPPTHMQNMLIRQTLFAMFVPLTVSCVHTHKSTTICHCWTQRTCHVRRCWLSTRHSAERLKESYSKYLHGDICILKAMGLATF